jgi:hypothetical protein
MALDFSALQKLFSWLLVRPEKKSNRILKVLITSLIITGIVLIYYISVWDSLPDFVLAMDHTDMLFGDFTDEFYPMGEEVMTTRMPLPGYYYPPVFAIFLSIFVLLTPAPAFYLWGACQLATIALLVIIPGTHFLRKSLLSFYLYLLLVLTSFPVLHNLKWGQISVPVIALVLISLSLYRKKHSIASGIFLALSAAAKYFTGIFVLYFLFRKDMRFVAAFLISSIILWIAIPFIFLGIGDSLKFYQALVDPIIEARTWLSHDSNSQYFVYVVSRLFQSDGASSILALIGYMIVVFNISLAYLMARKKIEDDSIWAFVLCFASLPFVLWTSWPHYFAYLPFCQVFVGMTLFGSNARHRLLSRVKTILLLIPSVMLSNIVFFNILDDRMTYVRSGCLFFANLSLLILVYWQTIPGLLSGKIVEGERPIASTEKS